MCVWYGYLYLAIFSLVSLVLSSPQDLRFSFWLNWYREQSKLKRRFKDADQLRIEAATAVCFEM